MTKPKKEKITFLTTIGLVEVSSIKLAKLIHTKVKYPCVMKVFTFVKI